jgi:hypothetical protein
MAGPPNPPDDAPTAAAIYFCHACGQRLKPHETKAALSRGESHNTICCETCARQGKRIRNPAAYEDRVFKSHEEMAEQPPPAVIANTDDHTANQVAPPLPNRRTTTRVVAAARNLPPPGETRRARPPEAPKHHTTLIIGGASVGIIGVLILVFALSSSPPPEARAGSGTAKDAARPGAVPATSSPVRKTETAGAPTITAPTPTTTPVPVPPPPTGASGPSRDDLEAKEALVKLYITQKNFGNAQGRLTALNSVIPKDDPGFADWRAKAGEYAKQIEEGSQKALADLLTKAKDRAEHGKFSDLQKLFQPSNLDKELLPAHREQAQQEEAKLRELAQDTAKTAEEKRQAVAAKQREEAEKNLPGGDALAAAPGDVRILFGPEPASQGVTWDVGANAALSPPGKLKYLDGTQKVGFKGAFGMIGPARFIIEYSAVEDCDLAVEVPVEQFGTLKKTIRLPAGTLSKQVIAIDNAFAGSGKLGRSIHGLNLTGKNIKPGTLSIFRIYQQ